MMFHSSHMHMPNRRGRPRCGFRSFMPTTSFNRQDSKEPLRRGILFSSVAFVLLLVGAMLTWLGLNEPFSNKISMTGPLLIAIAMLVLLLSLRQFMLARKRNRAINGTVQMDAISTGGVTAVVVDDEDGNRAATIVVEAWDTDEPLNEEIRNPGELAPPAYTDISQSCSSMCPSFISHDDHNEAPPTYEETCAGTYLSGSENSLSQPGSHHNSPQHRRRSSVQPSPPGYVCSQQTSEMEHDGAEEWRRMGDSTCLLSPANSGALMAQAAVRRQRQALPPLTLIDNPDQQPMLPPTSSSIFPNQENSGTNAFIRVSSPENMSPSSQVQSPDNSRWAATAPPTPVPPGLKQAGVRELPQTWSRRSFSSIPSYTCLLSKSGEVSAQVFDTSSIIQGMIPHSFELSSNDGQAEKEQKIRQTLSPTAVVPPGASDLLPSHSAIPARSHSLTSVVPLRQGVPYNACLAQKQSRSPVGSHVISSPHLTSQHCEDLTQQLHQEPLQQHGLDSSNSHMYRSSTSLSCSNPVSEIHSQNGSFVHTKERDSDQAKETLNAETNMENLNLYNLHLEVVDEAQASGRQHGEVDESKIMTQSVGRMEDTIHHTGTPLELCLPVLSSQDVQETI